MLKLAFALLLAFPLLAQDFKPATTASANRFLGTWQSTFNGSRSAPSSSWRTGNRVTGTASHANIEVSPSGELTKAEVLEGSDPITDARISADRLRITTKST